MGQNRKLLLVLVVSGAVLWAALHWPSPEIAPNSPESPLSGSSSGLEGSLPAISHNDNSPAKEEASPFVLSTSPPASLTPHLRKIGECLEIQNSYSEDAEMSFSALNSSIQNELGGVVEKNLDWKNVHLILPNGEKRRLRLEVEAVSEEASGLRLKYYGVDQEDLPVPLPLPEDQSLNPSDTFIASLEGEGQVTFREEAFRTTYGKDSELYHVERNGVLTEAEILHNGKSVKCMNLQTSNGSCQCF